MENIKISDLTFSNSVTPFTAEFLQFNVIMGANGSGKSRLLYGLTHQIRTQIAGVKIITIEGGRQANIDVNIGVDNQSIDILNNPGASENAYVSNRTSTIASRMRITLRLIKALEIDRKAVHSDAVELWKNNGYKGDAPKRDELPFDRLSRIFSDVFPDLKLTITSANQIYVMKGGEEYPALSMSDGEKQVFILVADLLSMRIEESIFLVDEPELNLHPSLAESFWSVVENEFSTSLFIYATHSISFALRDSIQRIFVLGFGEVDREHLFSHEQIGPFLGSLPKVIGKKRCLLVEGNDSSLDSPLYRWLTSRTDFSVLPIGGSSEVALASAREGLWSGLESSIFVLGLIDRDFKPADFVYKNCITLPYHEAECIISHPDIVFSLQQKLSNLEKVTTKSEMIEAIKLKCQEFLISVVAKRVFNRLTISLGVSAERREIAFLKNEDELLTLVKKVSTIELAKATLLTSESGIENIVREEYTNAKTAIDNSDIEEMLRIFEGKRILSVMLPFSGCQTSVGMVKAMVKHLKPEDFSILSPLREKLISNLFG